MATDTPYNYSRPDQDMKMDQDVRSSTKSLETTASPTGGKKQRGCCSRCLNCFFCYLPWISIILCVITLAAAVVSLATIQRAAKETKTLMDDLGFSDQGFATKVLRAVPTAVLISLIVMAVVVVAVFLLAILRSNQRAIHNGIYRGGCCERSCCYWGFIVPAWIVSAVWWILMVLVVVLLMALVVWLFSAVLIYYASDFAIKESGTLSGKLNQAQANLVSKVQDFVQEQNNTVTSIMSRNPILLQQWNEVMRPVAGFQYQPAGCADGCLDVSLFGDAFGSKKCLCAEKELTPLKEDAKKIVSILIVSLVSTGILYLAASLLLVILTQGNTNAVRDKNELKQLRAQKAQENQFIQSSGVEQA